MIPIQVYMPSGEARESKMRAAIEADKQGRFAWGGNASDLPGDVQFRAEDKLLDVELKDFTGDGNSDYLASILNGHLWDQVTRATGPYVIAVLGDDADISSSIRKAAGHGKKGKHGSFDLDKFASYANMVDGFEANCIARGIQVWHLGYNQFPRLLLRARKILEGGDLSGFCPKPAERERQAVGLSILAGRGVGPTMAANILKRYNLCLILRDGYCGDLTDCEGIGPKRAETIKKNIEVMD